MNTAFPKYKIVVWGNIATGARDYGIRIQESPDGAWRHLARDDQMIIHAERKAALADIRAMKVKA